MKKAPEIRSIKVELGFLPKLSLGFVLVFITIVVLSVIAGLLLPNPIKIVFFTLAPITVIVFIGTLLQEYTNSYIIKNLNRYIKTRLERKAIQAREQAEREEALVNATPEARYIVSLLDKEHEAQQEELDELRSLLKPRPFRGFITNLIWAVVGVVGGILATWFLH